MYVRTPKLVLKPKLTVTLVWNTGETGDIDARLIYVRAVTPGEMEKSRLVKVLRTVGYWSFSNPLQWSGKFFFMFSENKALDQNLGANPKKHIFCFIFHQFSCFFFLIQLKALNMLKSRFWPEFGVCSTPMQWLSKYATQINFYKVRIKIKFTPSAVSVSSFGEILKNTMALDLVW